MLSRHKLLLLVSVGILLLLMLLHLEGHLELLLGHLLATIHFHGGETELCLRDKRHFTQDRELLLGLVAELVRLVLRRLLHLVLMLGVASEVGRGLAHCLSIGVLWGDELLLVVEGRLLTLDLLLLLLLRVSEDLACLLALELAGQGDARLRWQHAQDALDPTLRLRLSQVLL